MQLKFIMTPIENNFNMALALVHTCLHPKDRRFKEVPLYMKLEFEKMVFTKLVLEKNLTEPGVYMISLLKCQLHGKYLNGLV